MKQITQIFLEGKIPTLSKKKFYLNWGKPRHEDRTRGKRN